LLFAGNALATHDIEQSFFGTSLGISLEHGGGTAEGHEHHLRSINRIRRLGGIRNAVEQGVLTNGIMYECVRAGIPFVLAGSIRDDGPLPEVITDVIEAQQAMRKWIQTQGVTFCLMIATTLHSIAVGNLLPASVKTVCVDEARRSRVDSVGRSRHGCRAVPASACRGSHEALTTSAAIPGFESPRSHYCAALASTSMIRAVGLDKSTINGCGVSTKE